MHSAAAHNKSYCHRGQLHTLRTGFCLDNLAAKARTGWGSAETTKSTKGLHSCGPMLHTHLLRWVAHSFFVQIH